jgi:bacterioferritin (cytochrome b1)
MMEILNRLQKFFSRHSKGNGDRELIDVVDILIEHYQNLIRLAKQITAHAERAPYPHVAQHLRQISLEQQNSANALKEKILYLGGNPQEANLELRSGKNHWARILQDIKDQKELENQLSADASRLALESPEITDLLRRIVAGEVVHRETLQDLIARADPQANQT